MLLLILGSTSTNAILKKRDCKKSIMVSNRFSYIEMIFTLLGKTGSNLGIIFQNMS